MKDCLVTTTKKSVSADLEYLGGTIFHFDAVTTPSLSNRVLTLYGTVEKAKIINNPSSSCYFTNFETSANYGDEITEGSGIIVASNARLIEVAGTGECDIVVFTRYGLIVVNTNVNNIRCTNFNGIGLSTDNGCVFWLYYNTTNGGINLGNIFQNTKFKELHLNGTNSTAKIRALEYIEDFSNMISLELHAMTVGTDDFTILCGMSELTTLSITDSKPVSNFSVASLAQLTKLTSIEVLDITTTFGAIENFVIAQRANGRTTCAGISWKYAGYLGCTFNGTAVAKNSNAMTLSWTASTITFNGVTITA